MGFFNMELDLELSAGKKERLQRRYDRQVKRYQKQLEKVNKVLNDWNKSSSK